MRILKVTDGDTLNPKTGTWKIEVEVLPPPAPHVVLEYSKRHGREELREMVRGYVKQLRAPVDTRPPFAAGEDPLA